MSGHEFPVHLNRVLHNRWLASLLLITAVVLSFRQVFARRVSHRLQSTLPRVEVLRASDLRDARDLNDDILQGFHGLLLTFHVAIQRVAPEHVSRPLLEEALRKADLLLVQTRQRAEQLAAGTPSTLDATVLESHMDTSGHPQT